MVNAIHLWFLSQAACTPEVWADVKMVHKGLHSISQLKLMKSEKESFSYFITKKCETRWQIFILNY